MREGREAPTLELSAEDLAGMQALLDGLSRIELAVWALAAHSSGSLERPAERSPCATVLDEREAER
jgi:hypothetical protein